MTHLAKNRHSTKWPSANIINSLKHILLEIKELNYDIYTYMHKRQSHILKMQFYLQQKGRANGTTALTRGPRGPESLS